MQRRHARAQAGRGRVARDGSRRCRSSSRVMSVLGVRDRSDRCSRDRGGLGSGRGGGDSVLRNRPSRRTGRLSVVRSTRDRFSKELKTPVCSPRADAFSRVLPKGLAERPARRGEEDDLEVDDVGLERDLLLGRRRRTVGRGADGKVDDPRLNGFGRVVEQERSTLLGLGSGWEEDAELVGLAELLLADAGELREKGTSGQSRQLQ